MAESRSRGTVVSADGYGVRRRVRNLDSASPGPGRPADTGWRLGGLDGRDGSYWCGRSDQRLYGDHRAGCDQASRLGPGTRPGHQQRRRSRVRLRWISDPECRGERREGQRQGAKCGSTGSVEHRLLLWGPGLRGACPLGLSDLEIPVAGGVTVIPTRRVGSISWWQRRRPCKGPPSSAHTQPQRPR